VAVGRSVRRPLAYLRGLTAPSGAVRYSRTSTQTPVWVTAQALAAFAKQPFPLRRVSRKVRAVAATAAPTATPTPKPKPKPAKTPKPVAFAAPARTKALGELARVAGTWLNVLVRLRAA
jgi:hypothetical protein